MRFVRPWTRWPGLIGAPAIERLAPGDLADWSMQQQVLQGREAWETARAWIDRVNPRLSFEVGERYIAGRSITDEEVEEAKPARRAIVDRMGGLLAAGTVICLPTTPFPAPPKDQKLSERQAPRSPHRCAHSHSRYDRRPSDQPAGGRGRRYAGWPIASGRAWDRPSP